MYVVHVIVPDAVLGNIARVRLPTLSRANETRADEAERETGAENGNTRFSTGR